MCMLILGYHPDKYSCYWGDYAEKKSTISGWWLLIRHLPWSQPSERVSYNLLVHLVCQIMTCISSIDDKLLISSLVYACLSDSTFSFWTWFCAGMHTADSSVLSSSNTHQIIAFSQFWLCDSLWSVLYIQ